MKKLYLVLFLISLSFSSFAQTYTIYTAKKSGKWDDASVWNTAVRTDNIMLNKIIIPQGITITADDDVNNLGLGNLQILIMGTLKIANKTTLNFSNETTIQVLGTGEIIANGTQQQIWIGSSLKYDGDIDKKLGGPAYASSTTSASPLGFLAGSLPVNFVSFTVIRNNGSIMLNWSVSEQTNNDHYEIEKSINGSDWKQIAIVFQSAANQSTENYSFTDREVISSNIYYRIKQVDKDGQSKYSVVRFVKPVGSALNSATVFAASKNRVTIRFEKELNKDVNVRLVNISGNVHTQQSFKKAGTQLNLDVNTMPSGIYVVQMNDNAGWAAAEKIMIQ